MTTLRGKSDEADGMEPVEWVKLQLDEANVANMSKARKEEMMELFKVKQLFPLRDGSYQLMTAEEYNDYITQQP